MEIVQKTLKQGKELRSSKEKYEIVSVLGRGNFGITYRAKVEIMHGNIPIYGDVAIKEFFMPAICMREEDGTVTVNALQKRTFNECMEDFREEAEALKKMVGNKGVVKVNETFAANGTFYYVMEYLGEVSLKQHITQTQSMSEEEAVPLFCKIAAAVGSLHAQKRLHLDIKPGNIMMQDGEPKLIDFGQSHQFGKSRSTKRKPSAACSDGYAPLEQYSGITRFMPQADIYALGAVLFFMITGKKPLPASELTPEYIEQELPHGISSKTREIIYTCLARDAADRYCCIDDMLRLLPPCGDIDDDITILLADIPKPKTYYTRKIIGSLLGTAIALTVIVTITVLVQHFRPDNTDTATHVTEDETPVKTVSKTATGDTTEYTKTSVQREETPKTEDVKHTKEAVSQPSPVATPTHPAATKRNATSIGWATWSGKCDSSGNPVGFGTLTVRQKKQIRESVTLYPGDRITDCEFYGNTVYQGTLYRAGSNQPEYISPE